MIRDTEDVVARLRKDADRQDGEDESIVSTNCMRNAADLIQSLSDRIDVLRGLLIETQDTIRLDANDGNSTLADLWNKIEDALDRAALHQEGITAEGAR